MAAGGPSLGAMGIGEDIVTPEGWHAALAALAWQCDLGVTEAMGDAPVNRYELPDVQPGAVRAAVAEVQNAERGPDRSDARGRAAEPRAQMAAPDPVAPDPVVLARAVAARVANLAELRAALEAFDLCELKRGAKSTVFADGDPAARVMVIGEAPGRDEDSEGRPFVGWAGQLLDRMFAAIGLGRASPRPGAAIYITNVMPWRPPQDRDPTLDEIAMMQPFLQRHVELVAPDLIVVMGNTACQAVLGRKGISQMRGQWAEGHGRPVLPMFHPAYLLRNPSFKREAWADLLELQARLRALG